MADIKISAQEWEILKIKFTRKYNHVTEEELAYTPGQEQELIERLAKRVGRSQDYILFTLKKGLSNLDSNRL